MERRGFCKIVFFFCIVSAFHPFAWSQSVPMGMSLTIKTAPPAIPIYDLPSQPDQSQVWVPGYWAWHTEDNDFFWVPGMWTKPPSLGLLWTPGYWGFRGNGYFYYVGFWGENIGFYGGINYGHGYSQTGFDGGEWKEGKFYPNKPKKPKFGGGASFNGPGGVEKRPSEADLVAAQKKSRGATKEQMRQEREARGLSGNRASKNSGVPKVAATIRVGDFNKGAVAGRASN